MKADLSRADDTAHPVGTPAEPAKPSGEAGKDNKPPAEAEPQKADAGLARPTLKPSGEKARDLGLQDKSSIELVKAILDMAQELQTRMMETRTLTEVPKPVSFRSALTTDLQDFVRVPQSAPKAAQGAGEKTWRIILVSSNPKHKVCGLEVVDDIVIGRKSIGEELMLDLDLTDYDAFQSGVSRRHALLRPGIDSLMLLDMGSANGTSVNQERLKPYKPSPVADGDVISFGQVHFKLKIVSSPAKTS
jgi:hypothetical protein